MIDTSSVGNVKSAGLIQGKRLRPFEIAVLLIPACNGGNVRIINASDEEFQAFIQSAGLPVDDQGMAEWSFDDRVGIINHALKHGVPMPFVDPNKNNSESEQKTIPDVPHEVAQEAS